MRTYSRDDVQTHYGSDRPAVNVKVYGSLWDTKAWDYFRKTDLPDDGFTAEWIEENVDDRTLDAIFWMTCEWEFEYLEGWATGSDRGDDALFPDDNVTLEQDGRSGGWIVVKGLPDIDEWDVVRLARWRKFERIARGIADDIPYLCLSSIYSNEWEADKQEAEEAERAAWQDIATVSA